LDVSFLTKDAPVQGSPGGYHLVYRVSESQVSLLEQARPSSTSSQR